MRKLIACVALAMLFAVSPASAQTVTQRMQNVATIGNMGLANSTGVTIVNAQAATGLGTIFQNVNGYANHYITITTTGSPTYTLTLVGCFEATCAATNQTVTLVTSGSVTTTPLVLTAGGYYPYLAANVVALSAGTISVTYSGSVLAANASDAMGRTLIGNSNRPTYNSTFSITVPTAASSMAAIEADANNKVRLRYIKICLGVGALQTTAGARTFVLFRSTAASTGGATATPIVYDGSDVAFGGIARSGALTTTPAVGSVTVANAFWTGTLLLPAAATSDGACVEKYFDLNEGKAPVAAAGVANGIALADITGGVGGAGLYNVDLSWTAEPN